MATNDPLVNVISVDQLAAVVKNKLDKVLIIDGRSFLEFNTCHVMNAVNVCCSKIVKRRLQQNKVCVKDFLMSTCHIIAEESFDVIVYDQSSSDFLTISSDSFVFVLLKKLSCVFNTVNLLQGGFLEFQSKYLNLCEDKTRKGVPLVSLSQPCLPITNSGPTRILPFLYLGSQLDAMNKELLSDHNIAYELNVSAACPKPDFIAEGHFMRIPVNDNYSEKLLPYFPMAFQFIDKVKEANSSVLIHCLAGISRSPTVAIAYIMHYLHMSSDDAYRYVKSKRATISPNFNFLGQLLEYEHQLRKENIVDYQPGISCTLGNHGNKRHCRGAKRALPKIDLKLPVTCEHIDTSVATDKLDFSGQESPTSALSKLTFASSERNLDVADKSKQKKSTQDKRIGLAVQKSLSTSNIWSLNSSFWFSERRLSFDASSCPDCRDCHHFSRTKHWKCETLTAKNNVSFDGLEGIPFSSLEHINFTPCQTSLISGDSKHEIVHKSLESSFNCDTLHENDNQISSEASLTFHSGNLHSQTSFGTFSSESLSFNQCMDLNVSEKNKLEEIKHSEGISSNNTTTNESPLSRESSPRPTSISVVPLKFVPLTKDLEDDEGIDMKKEEDEVEMVKKRNLPSCSKLVNTQVQEHACVAATRLGEQIENLESSYDSGVFPSPTQFEFGEIFHSDKKHEGNWLASYEEENEDSTMEMDLYFPVAKEAEAHVGTIMNNAEAICTPQANLSSRLSAKAPIVIPVKKSIAAVFQEKYLQFRSSLYRKEDRLYRAHSCPGIFGWMHCNGHSKDCCQLDTGFKQSHLRRIKLSSLEQEMRLHNRYSCGSLDLMPEQNTLTFDSCPDFGQYCQHKHDRNPNSHRSSDQTSLSPTFHSFLQNTGIIQVS